MVKKEDIIRQIKFCIKILNKNQIPIQKAILFGSHAKNNATPSSDIDVALVSDKFTGIRFHDIEKILPLLIKINPYIEIHPFTLDDFNQHDNWFLEDIKQTGIEIT